MSKLAFKTKTAESQPNQQENVLSIEKSETKNSIYFVGGEKGGVGKSFFSRCMLDYFIHKGWSEQFTLIEADPTINDVSSTYSDNYDEVVFSDNKFENDEPNLIIDKAEEKTVIVNLPSNVTRSFNEWLQTARVLSPEAKEYYANIIYFFVSDGCYRSVKQFISQVEQYSRKDLPHCLVLNPGRLTCAGTFHYLEQYKPLMETIATYETPILLLPELKSKLQFFCDLNSLSYRELGSNQGFAAKQNIKNFLDRIDFLFDMVFPEKINSPEGLIKITKEQKEFREKRKLPLPPRRFTSNK